jgi:hypothetical protein
MNTKPWWLIFIYGLSSIKLLTKALFESKAVTLFIVICTTFFAAGVLEIKEINNEEITY